MKRAIILAASLILQTACTTAPTPRYEAVSAYVVPSADLVVLEVMQPVVTACQPDEDLCEETVVYTDLHTVLVHGATARISGQGRPTESSTPLMRVVDPPDTDIRPLEFPMPPRFAIRAAPDNEFDYVERTPDGTGWLYQNDELGLVALVRANTRTVVSAELAEDTILAASDTQIQLVAVRDGVLMFASAPIDTTKTALTLTKVEPALEEGELGFDMTSAVFSPTGLHVALQVLDTLADSTVRGGSAMASKTRIAIIDLAKNVRVKTITTEHPSEVNFASDSTLLITSRPRPTDPEMRFLMLATDESIGLEKPFSTTVRRQIPGSPITAYFQQDSVIYVGPSGEVAEFPRPRGAVIGAGPVFFQLLDDGNNTVLVQFDIATGEEVERARFGEAELLGQTAAGLVVLELSPEEPGARVFIIDADSDASTMVPVTIDTKKQQRIQVYGPR